VNGCFKVGSDGALCRAAVSNRDMIGRDGCVAPVMCTARARQALAAAAMPTAIR
jgi:hypothetical protein